MFVSGWKWWSGIKDGPLPSPAVCESSASVKKTLIEKKKKKKGKENSVNIIKLSGKSENDVILIKNELKFCFNL